MMKLQIALDELSIEQGIAVCQAAREFLDIIEIGTPFLLREGMHAVRAFRQEFPDKELLADAKIMDAGEAEAAICFEAGADYVTVLAVTDILTVRACVETAERYQGRMVADMICVDDLAQRAGELEEAGVRDIAVHTGIDQQHAGRTPLQDLRQLRACTRHSRLSVAGGICADTVGQYADADIVIVGGAIAHAADPAAAARAISQKIRL